MKEREVMKLFKILPRYQIAIGFGVTAFVSGLFVFGLLFGPAQVFSSMLAALAVGLVISWLVYDPWLVWDIVSSVHVIHKIRSVLQNNTLRYIAVCLSVILGCVVALDPVFYFIAHLAEHPYIAIWLYCYALCSLLASTSVHFFVMINGATRYQRNDQEPIGTWTRNILRFSPLVLLFSPIVVVVFTLCAMITCVIGAVLAFAELLMARQFLAVSGGVVAGSLISVLTTGTEGMFLMRLMIGVVSGMLVGKGLYSLGTFAHSREWPQNPWPFFDERCNQVSRAIVAVYST